MEWTACTDATALAGQLGRLDLVSLLLAGIGLILVLGGVFAFINFRSIARSQATEEAKERAKEVAERVANEYLQGELPGIIDANLDLMDRGSLSDDDTNSVAEAQDEQTEDQQ